MKSRLKGISPRWQSWGEYEKTTGIAGKLFNTIGRNGINVIACAQGASQINISFVIEKKSLQEGPGCDS